MTQHTHLLGARASSFRSPLRLALAGGLACLALSACGGGGGDPTPTLTAPSTGAVWGGMQTIRWVPANADGGTAQIQLSTDGGASFPTTLAGSTPDDGAFAFDTTAQSDGVTFRVRIVTSEGPVLTSGTFAVDNTDPSTTLTAPLGAEVWGGDQEISWTTTDVHPGTVELRLSTNGGVSFDTLIVAATADDGSYMWTTAPIGDGTTYRVQVTPTDLAENMGLASSSATSFELDNTAPIINLTSPNGAESWSALQNITWTTTDANPGTVALTLSADSGSSFPTTVAAAAPDTGTYAWQTGEAGDGTTFRVRAVATDVAGNVSVADTSAADFSMVNLRLTGPVHFRDINQSGSLDAGDQLHLKFDKDVTLNTPATTDLELAVTGDAFGAGATVAAGSELDAVVVTLGAAPAMRPRGTFDALAVTAGRPSGLDVSSSIAADAIESTATGLDAAPSGVKDVRPDVVRVDVGVATSGSASAGALGDLDGDGDVDVIVAESGGSGTQVLLGDGLGGFTSGGTIGTTTGFGVAIGDVDGDGDLDHVLAAGAGARISLGDGTGGFAAYGTAVGSGSTRAVALADLDCDGDLDLFLGNTGGGADLVLLGDGAGGFTSNGQSLGTGNTESLAVGDLDGDGDLDVVAASNAGGQPVRAWMNGGAGTFTAGDAITLTAVQDVALGDMDGDGDLDVVVGVLGQCEVLMNDGSGNFGATFQYFGNNDNRGIALADLDLDGDLDIVTVKDLDAERWWFNDGTGRVTESGVRGAPDNAAAVLAARLDGDADTDLLVLVDGANHRAYFGSAAGMQPQALYADAGLSTSSLGDTVVASADLDGDGLEDVLVVTAGGQLRRLPGHATTGLAADVLVASGVGAVRAVLDADCDGDLDLVCTAPASTAGTVYLNDGAAAFTAGQTGLTLGLSDAGDVDGDGDLDLVTANAGAIVLTNSGAGVFTPAGAAFGPADTDQVLLDDADHDGDLDLYLGTASQNAAWAGDGTGAFTFAASVGSARGNRLTLLDLDGDGDRDLIGVVASGAATLEPVRNDGSLAYTTLALTGPTASAGSALAVVDPDDDRAADLFFANPTNGAYALYSNGGAGIFTVTATTGTITNVTGVVALDVDADGDLDVYLSAGTGASPAQDELHVLD